VISTATPPFSEPHPEEALEPYIYFSLYPDHAARWPPELDESMVGAPSPAASPKSMHARHHHCPMLNYRPSHPLATPLT
jgi:hypothetical protein